MCSLYFLTSYHFSPGLANARYRGTADGGRPCASNKVRTRRPRARSLADNRTALRAPIRDIVDCEKLSPHRGHRWIRTYSTIQHDIHGSPPGA